MSLLIYEFTIDPKAFTILSKEDVEKLQAIQLCILYDKEELAFKEKKDKAIGHVEKRINDLEMDIMRKKIAILELKYDFSFNYRIGVDGLVEPVVSKYHNVFFSPEKGVYFYEQPVEQKAAKGK
jgi:hypothetical protein